jgi:hypothetical protein
VGGKELVKPDAKKKTTLQNIADAKAALGHVDYWYFGLGTNSLYMTDSQFRAAVDQVLDAVGPRGHVDWIDIAFFNAANPKAKVKNPVLAAACAARSNVDYNRWNAWIHDPARFDPADWLAPADLTHMTTRGYAKRSKYLADTIGAPALPGTATTGRG